MRIGRRTGIGGLAVSLVVALAVPLLGVSGVGAAPAPGCTAVGYSFQECSYVTGGGNLVYAAAPGTGGWFVYWGPPGDPFQNLCASNFNLAGLGRCRVQAGNVITASIITGVITVRDLPGKT